MTTFHLTLILGMIAGLFSSNNSWEANVWVSSPCGNNNHVKGISWPAAAKDCFAIGATKPSTGMPTLDRFSNTDILSPAAATSSSNAAMVGCAVVLREAIEKTSYDWKKEGKNFPEAMMAIFQKTGKEVEDPATGFKLREANLLHALDYVLSAGNLQSDQSLDIPQHSSILAHQKEDRR